MSPYNFFVCGPKFTEFCSLNVEGIVVDKMLFRFAICRYFPEILEIKVESYQKALQILDNFIAPANFRGRAFQKLYPFYHPCLAARRLDKRFVRILLLAPLGTHTRKFKPNFKFSRLKFFGGTPVPAGVCARKA